MIFYRKWVWEGQRGNPSLPIPWGDGGKGELTTLISIFLDLWAVIICLLAFEKVSISLGYGPLFISLCVPLNKGVGFSFQSYNYVLRLGVENISTIYLPLYFLINTVLKLN